MNGKFPYKMTEEVMKRGHLYTSDVASVPLYRLQGKIVGIIVFRTQKGLSRHFMYINILSEISYVVYINTRLSNFISHRIEENHIKLLFTGCSTYNDVDLVATFADFNWPKYSCRSDLMSGTSPHSNVFDTTPQRVFLFGLRGHV